MSLAIWFLLFLFVVFINFFSGMIVKVMHSRAQSTFHDAWRSICSMFTRFEAHIACVVLLTLLSFVLSCVLRDPTESCIMCVCFAKDAVPRCWRSSLWCSMILLLKSSLNIPVKSSIDILFVLIWLEQLSFNSRNLSMSSTRPAPVDYFSLSFCSLLIETEVLSPNTQSQ